MYLKFGFGRATQDAGIEIRRGAMTREQGVNLVRLYDGHYPEEFIGTYLEYYRMTLEEFDQRYPSSVSVDEIGTINHLDAGETIPSGTLVKRVVAGSP